ncbi:thiamine-phosphate kinase [[Mycobacterium] crassicus]|uniref:Thiamine-monophosphate kinase n=1 Tax=[Mycobacterium] crassicus TaxID=2872309 RepID=A0ABU5XLW4_9MYCO|nr:thiamine-phosphate kinase [Mycolicibacter sp. MYC098]MEB3023209.1 thiamine-phosphate kinase [Mycolicibacter sp. MYC098]
MRGNEPTLGQLGEFPMIDRLVSGRRQPATTELGPGDDAAVVRCADGRTVISTDMLIEGRHFRLDWSTPHDVGRKAIAQNAADVEAMGARPTAFVVAFGAPAHTSAADAAALADGMWAEAGPLGAGVVGGDLVQADSWVVSVTVLGDLAGRTPVLRSGARPGGTLAVIGDLGRSAAGLHLLRDGVAGFDELRQRHLTPEPPYGQGAVAADAAAQAMTDVSDGLIADLGHLAAASQVTIDVSTAGLAADHQALVAAGAAVGADPWSWVLGGGEDHALVAVFPSTVLSGALPAGWRVIGQVADGPARVLVDGAPWVGEAGWQSYDG